jgi:choline kinase
MEILRERMATSKQAIILAAGQGSRLWPYTQERPKCLLDIGGMTLLEHQVAALRSQNIECITVVIGYLGHKVCEVLGTQVEYVHNPHFVRTSSMYSLWLARDVARQGCLVLNADVLFHVGILQALLECPYPDALAVDFDAILAEEETKVQVQGERVWALSKTLPQGDAENVGMLKFSAAGSHVLFAKIDELLPRYYRHAMVPCALNAIAPMHVLGAVSVQGLPWIEIDFPEDYQRARDVIYPAMRQVQPASLSFSDIASSSRGGHT